MDGLNVSYGVKIEGLGQSYPAIQATTYQPRTMGESIQLCISEESFDLLSGQAREAINPTAISCNFGGDDVLMMAIGSELRFVMLGKPRVLCLDKETGEVTQLQKGMKLAGTKKVTATKLIMASVHGDTVLEADDGTPQIFTLKLTSNKTALVDGDRSNPEMRSLDAMNTKLLKHYGLRRTWLGHLVSVQLGVKPEKFTSKASGQSSVGIRFELMGGARPLPDPVQQRMGLLAQSEEVQELLKNPFASSNQEQHDSPAPPSAEPSNIGLAEQLYNQLRQAIDTAQDTDFLDQLEIWWNSQTQAKKSHWGTMGDRALSDAFARF